MVIIIDNYDSFTFNLFQFIGMLTDEVKVYRNDQITCLLYTSDAADE